jgi:hypothetical protein
MVAFRQHAEAMLNKLHQEQLALQHEADAESSNQAQ